MNCKPGQLAWIAVPAHFNGTGLEVLNNRVVRTVAMHPGSPNHVWTVDPPQRICLKVVGVDPSGKRFPAGEELLADGIPDDWLRPFNPDSVPVADQVTLEMVELT